MLIGIVIGIGSVLLAICIAIAWFAVKADRQID